MTTEEAFEKLINTKCWFRLVGVTSQIATAIKSFYKNGKVKLDNITSYLLAAGAVCEIKIISPKNNVFYEYIDAFEELLAIKDPLTILGITRQQYFILNKKFLDNPKSIRISTMHKYLEKAGYEIKVDWELPPEISATKVTQTQPSHKNKAAKSTSKISLDIGSVKHFTAINFSYAGIAKTVNIFRNIIHQCGWYTMFPNIGFIQSQLIEYRFQHNEMYLEEVIDMLEMVGYTYDLDIVSPYGRAFKDFQNAYKYLLITSPPKPSLYSFLNMTENDIKRINKRFGQSYVCIDMVCKYLIKSGYQISMNWHIVNSGCDAVCDMTTEEAFEKLIKSADLRKAARINCSQFSISKKMYGANKLSIDSLYHYLDKAGFVGFVQITCQPQSKTFGNYIEAFENMLSSPDVTGMSNAEKHQYHQLRSKFRNAPDTFRISTIHKYLTAAGYRIDMRWGDNERDCTINTKARTSTDTRISRSLTISLILKI